MATTNKLHSPNIYLLRDKNIHSISYKKQDETFLANEFFGFFQEFKFCIRIGLLFLKV